MLCGFLSLVLIFNFSYAQHLGAISGSIVDKETHQPIEGVNFIIINTARGAASDQNGSFVMNNIPVGSYTVQVSMIGYSGIVRPNVNINSNKLTQLNFYMEKSVIEGKAIFVSGGYFEKTQDAVVSNRTMDYEEIRSDPVGVYDIQMMMQALPGVVSESDQSNELIVRGGSAGENLFIMDNLEIPNPNHFGRVGAGGGPINLINSDFIDKIDFFAGGFPAKYGDKQSSVMDVTLREGNKQNHEIKAEANMAGLGLTMEGPMIKNRASYMGSYKKSFLKYVIKSAGLTAIPEYWNGQTKVVYYINNKEKLTFNFITGDDIVKVDDESRPDLPNADRVDHHGNQATYGLTYKSLFSSKGYYQLTLAKSSSEWNNDIYKIVNGNKNTYMSRNNIEEDSYLKGQVVYKLTDKVTISAGFNIKEGAYSMNERFDEDTLYIYYYYNENLDKYNLGFSSVDQYNEWIDSASVWYSSLENIEPQKYFTSNGDYFNWLSDEESERSLNPIIGVYDDNPLSVSGINPGLNHNSIGSLKKYSAYVQFKFNLLQKIKLTLGTHYNNIPFNNTNQLSPRFGISYNINPTTLINLAYGKYYQAPSYWMLLNPFNIEHGGSVLKSSHTEQVILGLERYFSNDIRATLEIYNKEYHNTPVYYAALTPDLFDSRMGFDDVGRGNSKGIEFFLQKKYSNNWYTTLSYSNSRSLSEDPREWKNGSYARTYDYGQVLTFIGGYKLRFRKYNWYNVLRADRILKNLLYLPIMPSDILEISFRYSYMGGRPHTKRHYEPTFRRWSYDDDWNTERYNYYSRLDIMILRRFNFNKINIITFMDLQNVFDRINEWEKMYLEDGTTEMAHQYKQLTIGGIIIEF